jgi:hypothetical protein
VQKVETETKNESPPKYLQQSLEIVDTVLINLIRLMQNYQLNQVHQKNNLNKKNLR